jgi:hypothetical protein
MPEGVPIMSKRNIIITLLVLSTILSLLTTFLSYFGITRYFSCHIKNSNNFIQNYSKLPKTSERRVVISFSVNPNKLNKLKPFINSILDQTVKVDLIAMIIPDDGRNMNYVIPDYIKDFAVIFHTGRGYGKGTKLIPMLLREKECDTTIIALDENIVYGQDFIYSLIEESKKYSDSVLTDKKGTFMLFKPEHFGCDVIDRENYSLDNDWFLQKAFKSKIFKYRENYKIM